MSNKPGSLDWTELAKRCWEGYEPVPGKKPYSKDSCKPKKKKLKKNDDYIDIEFYEDGSFNVFPSESISDDKFETICKAIEGRGHEDLEKKDWQPKAKHKSDKGGLTAAGRKSYNKATGGNLKAPQPGGGPRKRSFCARNKGQIDMHNIDCKKDPEKRACKARKRWKC